MSERTDARGQVRRPMWGLNEVVRPSPTSEHHSGCIEQHPQEECCKTSCHQGYICSPSPAFHEESGIFGSLRYAGFDEEPKKHNKKNSGQPTPGADSDVVFVGFLDNDGMVKTLRRTQTMPHRDLHGARQGNLYLREIKALM